MAHVPPIWGSTIVALLARAVQDGKSQASGPMRSTCKLQQIAPPSFVDLLRSRKENNVVFMDDLGSVDLLGYY